MTTADVRSRLLHSIVPFNPKFYDISETSPDLYGPFWIYTTLIFVIAAAGSLAKYINQTDTTNFFQTFVPISAGIVSIYYLHKIYGIGFGLPILLTILMKCFGSSTNFVSVLIYLIKGPLYLWILLHYFHTNSNCLCCSY